MKIEKIAYQVIFLLVVLAINAVYTNYIVEKNLNDVAAQLPKITTIDMEKMVLELSEETGDPVETIMYTKTLVDLLTSKGFIVLDSQYVLNAPDKYKTGIVESDVLYKEAENSGLDREKYMAAVKAQLEKTERELDKLMQPVR